MFICLVCEMCYRKKLALPYSTGIWGHFQQPKVPLTQLFLISQEALIGLGMILNDFCPNH